MRRIDESELRFLLKLGLQRLPKSILQDLQRGNPDKREAALGIASDVLLGQLSRLEVHAPDPLKQHG